ncbi:uncharacterized protein LOC131680103 [Topomyia yanbarensis]|uniref:uncharacterized protein LOC131680103 n=1 Tax=Topomyia yanbarensis TaxID=2498891 RepID=UPI00273C1075|nr:uncharacterized protein LOC131680103 [Topomyia yanbarensis]
MNNPRICGKCHRDGSVNQMVGCDMCDVWLHVDCAGITGENPDPNKSWRCEQCLHDEVTEVASNATQKTTKTSSSVNVRRAELALKLLEEEQALLKRNREKEDEFRWKEAEIQKQRAEEDAKLLKQKHELLQSLDDGDGSIRSGISRRVSRKMVQSWLGGSEIPLIEKPQASAKGTQPLTVPVSGTVAAAISSTLGQQSGADILRNKNAATNIIVPKSTSTPHTTISTVNHNASVPIQAATSTSFANWGGYYPRVAINSSSDIPINCEAQKFSQTNILPWGFGAPSAAAFSSGSYSSQLPPVFASGSIPLVSSYDSQSAPQTIPVANFGGALAFGCASSSVATSSQSATSVSFPNHWNQRQLVSVVSTASDPVTSTGIFGQAQPVPRVYNNSNPVAAAANVNNLEQQQQGGSYYPLPPNMQQLGVPVQNVPSVEQIAARHVMQRDLPTFSGDPQDWPMFFSLFQNLTMACGYTDVENLSRLQRCLKGQALESVKSRLLLPQSVPHVMETLQMLYGRPEILIHSLLQKLRSVPSPKAENLQSIITYGLAVRNLVDHMHVSNLTEHLRNPMLVHELVEKLPPQMRMQWSWYKRSISDANLVTFGDFMSELVKTATDVTIPGDNSTKHVNAGREQQKLYVHTEAEGDQTAEPTANKPIHSRELVQMKRLCAYCSDDGHEVARCAQFKALDIDGRWKAIRAKGLCRTCLIPHRKWPCRSGKECGEEGCHFRHHPLLHSRAVAPTYPMSSENVTRQNHHLGTNLSLFRYLPITLEGNGKKVETFAFLDDGCESTLMEAEVAAELDIRGPEESLCLAWTGNISREEKGSQRISVTISGTGLKNKFQLNNVRTVHKLKLQGQSFQYTELQRTYPHLRGLPLNSYSNAVPRMIIGIEHSRLLTTLKVREGKTNEPVAAKTRLGCCVYGKQINGSTAVTRLHVHSEEIGNRELHELMRQYYNVEEAAVATLLESEDDKRARAILEKTTRRVGGGFETGLLWKYDRPLFPNSYPMAVRRMQSLEKRLDKEPSLRERVNVLITEYESKGYAHRITQREAESTIPGREWYLPLGIVRNPKKPEKIRLIWDAAARVNGVSLNDMLLKGPDMLTSLFAVLLRFRQKPVAVCGDIREMFHQIRIISQDRQSQRFVYREQSDQPPQVFVMDVATFGATCSPCSAQYIKNTNAEDFRSQFPRATEAILKAHYVDDYLDSVDTVDEAIQIIEEVKYVHAKGGFEIRHFSSNSREVLRRLGEVKHVKDKSMLLDKIAEAERVLGMVWKPAEDVFTFDVALVDDLVMLLAEGVTPTKRQVLRLVMSLFDPCGFIAHFIVHGKILMQHIWRSGTDWDEKISEGLLDLWNDWTRLLKRLGEVEVPRCFFGETSSKRHSGIQLHVFVDASELAYACVAYLRIIQEGKVRCVLVAAKTKVAPLKPLSIPRLELQAGLIGCRLMENISSSLDLPIEKRFVWTDSRTVLSWVRSDSRRYHPYVGFRVGEILNLSSVIEWHYVPSKQNVADEATKWGVGPNFSPISRWYVSQNFLYLPEKEWPDQPTKQGMTGEELRVVFQHHQQIPPPLIDLNRFSNWNRLLRATAYFLRAVQLFHKENLSGPLHSEELQQAENLLWRQVQFQAFSDEYCVLEFNKANPGKKMKQIEKCSPLYEQSPCMDDEGVIRMNSRIGAAPTVAFAAKFPILLPKDHRLTVLLVDSFHQRFKHQNHETVFNEIRQQFRIPKLRSLIKNVARDCMYCKLRKATPRPPMMAPLPKVRLTPHIRAFSYTGVDYFGPILVKQNRSLVKRWVALFTCLTVRAVHLEVVHSLSTQSCVMAIRRFVSRRGAPAAFYSDNGTCFKGSSNLLSEQIQNIHENCAETFTNARTSWHFNPPSAPHMGGSWERMVRSVKAAMAAVAEHSRHPTDEVLETVVLDAEAMVNSRPLTYVPLDDVEQEALTPNHFLLYGTQGVVQPRTVFVTEGSTLRDSWKLTQYLVDQCWRRWVREYLPTLTRRTKWFQPTKPLEPGDVVYVVDENKRNGWLRGRIIEVIAGRDGQVRRAVVQTSDGILTRPTVKLALMDVRPDRKENVEGGSPELHGRGDVKNRCKQTNRNVSSERSLIENCHQLNIHGNAAQKEEEKEQI